jgi:O-acetyl-ADP-ribose deacetylase (regulator of RNase III)
VAFPAVSAGIYGWPVEEVADVAVRAVRGVARAGSPVELVRFVLFGPAALAAFESALAAE